MTEPNTMKNDFLSNFLKYRWGATQEYNTDLCSTFRGRTGSGAGVPGELCGTAGEEGF